MNDPAVEFEDPFAGKVGWWAIKRGAFHMRFPCQVLIVRSHSRIVLRGNLLAKLFFWPPGLLGLALLGKLALDPRDLGAGDIALLGFMGVLLVVWTAFYWVTAPTVRFDRAGGFVTRASIPLVVPRKRVALSDVRALQLLRGTRGYSSFDCYELNLVLESGRRLNIAGHGSLGVIRPDARLLRSFLQVPLWDAADVDAPRRPRPPQPPMNPALRGVEALLAGVVLALLLMWSRMLPNTWQRVVDAGGITAWVGTEELFHAVGFWILALMLIAWGARRLLSEPDQT